MTGRSSQSPIFVLAIDVGSSSTRSSIFDSRGNPIPGTSSSEHYSIRYGPDGAAELSPLVLLRAVNECMRQSLRHRQSREIAAVSFSSFWHGLLGLNTRWQPQSPIYTWADSRAATAARDLRRRLNERRVHARTGCRIHSSYWPAKLRWLRRTSPGLFRRVALWVSPVDWITHQLFGTTHTTRSMASATGLWDRGSRQWDEEICRALSLSQKKLPQVAVLPTTASARSPRLPLRFVALHTIGDGAAGNLGSGAADTSAIAINVGTSAAARMISTKGKAISRGLFRYVLDESRFVVGGAVSNAGNLREWALRELRVPAVSRNEREIFSRSAAARDELTVLPFWVEERAPTWPDHQRGLIDGLKQTTTAAEITRAAATSVFYRLGQIVDLLQVDNRKAKRIIVSGGILKSPSEIELLADAVGHDIEISPAREASLRGAAVFALGRLGCQVSPLPRGEIVRHDRKLAALHKKRSAIQGRLERVICRADKL